VRILVTGAGGFAGTHLCQHLSACGDDVWGTVWPVRHTADIEPKYGEYQLIACNIVDTTGLTEVIEKVKPEGIIHLAGIAFVPTATRFPEQALKVNFLATANLLYAVEKIVPEARVVLVTSADVYGRVPRDRQPITETVPLAPVNAYGLSKAALDLLGYQMSLGNELQIMRARSFNHVGPRQSPEFVVASFAQQLAAIEKKEHSPVIQVGDLSVVRDFSDVRDIVRGYRLILARGSRGEAYNLCAGRGIKIKEILDKLLTISSLAVTVTPSSALMRVSDMPYLVGSNLKAEQELGWTPEIKLEDTLRDTLDYWRKKG